MIVIQAIPPRFFRLPRFFKVKAGMTLDMAKSQICDFEYENTAKQIRRFDKNAKSIGNINDIYMTL
ncbi:hypothetical protein GCM10010099_13380 [Streptomyces cinereus]|nr:hypothetical protein GCM10010099_13380 [Streptomyces cinereus]